MTTRVHVDLRAQRWGNGQQRDTVDRQRTYAHSIGRWVQSGLKMPLLVVENSNDKPFLEQIRKQLLDGMGANSSAGASANAEEEFELLAFGPSTSCTKFEIGCHEASAVLRAINASRLFGRHSLGLPRCTHALMVTGRYFVHDLPQVIERCPTATVLAVEHVDASFERNRRETNVVGFDTRLSEGLFDWSTRGGQCTECHITRMVAEMRYLQEFLHARRRRRSEGSMIKEQHRSDAAEIRRLGLYLSERASGPERPQDHSRVAESGWLKYALCELPLMRVDPVREGSTGFLRTYVRSR